MNQLRDINGKETLYIQGTFTHITKQPYGPQVLALELNAAGVPTGMADTATWHAGSEYIDTQWKPKLDTYTIEETVELEDGTSEQRVLIHDAANGDRYYINGTEQSVPPTLPPANAVIRLGSTAAIGNADAVSKRYTFRVWSYAMTSEEVQAL